MQLFFSFSVLACAFSASNFSASICNRNFSAAFSSISASSPSSSDSSSESSSLPPRPGGSKGQVQFFALDLAHLIFCALDFFENCIWFFAVMNCSKVHNCSFHFYSFNFIISSINLLDQSLHLVVRYGSASKACD